MKNKTKLSKQEICEYCKRPIEFCPGLHPIKEDECKYCEHETKIGVESIGKVPPVFHSHTKPSQQECKHGEDTICVTCAKQVQLQQKIPFWKQHPEIWDTHCPTCDGMFKGTRGLAIHKKKLCRKYPHPTKKGYCCACDYDIAGFEQALSQQQKEVEDRVRRNLTKVIEEWQYRFVGSEYDFGIYMKAVLTSIEEKGGKG